MPRLNVATSLGIDSFSGGVISQLSAGMQNAIVGRYPDGTLYVTQRPSINIFEDASATVADTDGRGIYYWNAVGARYFVNNDTVYKGNYSAPLAANLSAGTEKVYFFEVGNYLVIIDPENNEGWVINSSTSTTLTAISDVDFPPNQTPALTLCKGGAVVNSKLYVGTTSGAIYECDVENPTSWGALNFINAENSPDSLVMVNEHQEHVVAIGTQSTEYFYDNANTAGSTLNVRQDILHNFGTVNFDTVWNSGETLFFVSLNPSGDVNVLTMTNFQVSKISSDDIDSFLTSAVTTDGISLVGDGFTAAGRFFYVLTTYYVDGSNTPLQTIVYDSMGQSWGIWELAQAGINDCPIMSWTRSTATRAGEGILFNGDIVNPADDKSPQDTIEAQVYVESGYVLSGYISDTSGTGTSMDMEITTGQQDFGTREWKYAKQLRVAYKPTANSQTMTVKHSNEDNASFNTGRTVDTSSSNNKLTRLGRFRSRNHKLTYSGSDQIEILGIDLDV